MTPENRKLTKFRTFSLTLATKHFIRDSLFFLLGLLIAVALAVLMHLLDPDGQLGRAYGNLFDPVTQILSALVIGTMGVGARAWIWWADRRDELAAR
jgi:Trk-type K+ transport system membrane component